ncbi:MAG TPA: ABC transporter permease [Nitrososphaeraceae archaeon]|jgi:ABC-2 type transport system permease protein|nr:ABC transporter permease [Nitrososphaeraceae archaeon]
MYLSIFQDLELMFSALYAVWLREFKVFLRERSRLVASIFTPLLWLFVVGSGLGSTAPSVGADYQKFIFPGIISMSVIFSSVFFGSYIIWDRKFDFLKSVMVAPVNRETIFVGKTLGGMTTSLVQVSILLLVGGPIGIHLDAITVSEIVAIVLLLSFALTSLGLAMGSFIESLEGFQLIVSFVVFPLFFLSGALFPLHNLPGWLSFLTTINPVTYAVDALRNAMMLTSTHPFGLDTAILFASTVGLAMLGILSFGKMKAV